MSVPIDNLMRIGIPLAALTTAALGSGHCLAMCGGIAAAVGTTVRNLVAYQLGRLVAYLTLGALSGAIGARALPTAWHSPLGAAVALLSCMVMLATGLALWRNADLHLSFLARWNPSLRLWKTASPFVTGASARAALLGMLTPLLPCGWLYGFAVLAASTRHTISGAAVLGALWLGSLPALAAGPLLLRSLRFPQRRVIGTLLIAFALWNLFQKVGQIRRPDRGKPTAHCHGME